MNSSYQPGDKNVFPVTISVKTDTARLLSAMAAHLGISLEDIISVLAEDAAIDLEKDIASLDTVLIPDKCSKEDLLDSIKRENWNN
tara:strand:+ start:364 stop:621 length:258 start_codon:yes stop_codon:yes gene_type:complete